MASNNPLLPNHDNSEERSARTDKPDNEAAVELIRAKIARLYADEPDAKKEMAEADALPEKELSKHQKFMLELQSSGKSLAAIQTDWHNYYTGLSDNEKYQVWQEFYEQQSSVLSHQQSRLATMPKALDHPKEENAEDNNDASKLGRADYINYQDSAPVRQSKPIVRSRRLAKSRQTLAKNSSAIRSKVKTRALARAELESRNSRLKDSLKSLAFGLGTGFVVVLIFMFSFFNQKFIAPFIHPGRASATPIILDPTAISPTKQPEIIIPKINVQIPLVFSVTSTSESDVETALEDGVVHYPTTGLPGEKGNTAYFGHSSNNIFSPGKYKFAFVLLHKLKAGDLFYITYGKKIYVYKVYDKQIVSPTDVDVLNDVPGETATATLITCDPPGTSINRLVVWGRQISPSPSKNSQASQPSLSSEQPSKIAGNGPSLWDRIWPF